MWRLLSEGEIIRKGDQRYAPGIREWSTDSSIDQFVGCEAQEKYPVRRKISEGSGTHPTIDNTGYTAVLESEMKQFFDKKDFPISNYNIRQLAAHLNTALQKQHCA